MNLLITNDDGVRAPGIEALVHAFTPLADVWVVAPEREQSAQSHAFTLHKPLRVTEVGPQRFALSGTPADCAYAGIHGLVPKPDFVISGINRGANLGSDVHYSGTVAAARESVLQGVPSMAVSLYIRSNAGERRYAMAADFAVQVAKKAWTSRLPDGHFLNVNVPDVPLEEVKGLRTTGLGRRQYATQVEERQDPRGHRYIWIGGKPLRHEPDPDGDVTWARENWVTVTPMHTDPTAPRLMEAMNGWF